MAARFTATEVCRVLGLSEIAMSGSFTSVSTDTRNLQPGALFVALQGDRFDGTDFVMEAERLGAAGAVIPASAGEPPVDLTLFSVDDTTVALGDLARHYRQRCEARVVGVTGSSGKTTVKEMLVRAISLERRVHATVGNLNNQVGLPLSILAASDDTEVWVLELGASEPGEIRRLTSIAEPDDAVVTTVGPAHLEGLGDITGVLEEKLALVRGASRSGSVVVGELPEMLPEHAREIRDDVVTAGLGSRCDFRPAEWSLGPTEARFRHEGTDYSVPVGGEHHLRDALIATAMALAVGIGPAAIARGLTEYRPVGLRGALVEVGELTIVADCYNANPESFDAAIRYCADSFPGRRLGVVAGTMLELGPAEASAHADVASALLDYGFSLIVAVGAFQVAFQSMQVPAGVEVVYAERVEAVSDLLAERLDGNEVLLVKGSRGVRLERVIDDLARGNG